MLFSFLMNDAEFCFFSLSFLQHEPSAQTKAAVAVINVRRVMDGRPRGGSAISSHHVSVGAGTGWRREVTNASRTSTPTHPTKNGPTAKIQSTFSQLMFSFALLTVEGPVTALTSRYSLIRWFWSRLSPRSQSRRATKERESSPLMIQGDVKLMLICSSSMSLETDNLTTSLTSDKWP